MYPSECSTGTVTDENGNYQLKLAAGNYIISYSYIGFMNQTKNISLKENETLIVNLQLHSTANELNLIVVSASRYEKNITEETVSMEVLKPDFIKNVNAIGMNDVMKQVPGVTLIDNQANIRGGSGFSYGAGSRVLMLVDDIPQVTADANDIKWEFIPVENLNQVEVIKGASSVLYGSSALNGVINARTNYPTSVPQTQINFYNGYFLNPKRDQIIWWGNQQPNFAGGNFMHSKKIGQFDLVLGGNLYNEKSFHEGEYTQRGRINANTRYRFKNINGLSAGINTNYMYYQSGTYFLWADDTTGAYRPLGGLDTASTTISEGKNTRWNVDPFVNYFSKHGDHHSLKLRYFYTRNNNNTNQGSIAKLYYGEYQYQKQFHFGMNLIAGISANYSDVNAELYSDHRANNLAAFTQADKKFGKLSVVAGVRYETFSVDTANGTSKPVVRAGINYPVTKNTFLRASFGQGYRFPSIAEKYVSTSISLLKVFPNPEVQPEYGWTAEVGVKQAFKISNWRGYVDVAAFMQRYNDLIEFSFGYYDPNPIPDFININYLGFKSINIDNARITGAELSIIREGNIGKLKLNMLAGLTLINPINIDQKNFVDSVLASTDGLSQHEIDSLNQTKILNYRFETTAKISLDMAYKKFSCGINFQYNSFMKNVDLFFLGTDPLLIYIYGKPTEFIPGVAEYRALHDKGDFTFDLRLSYDLSEKVRFSFITKNLFNREYMVRPALLEAPRSVQAMLSVRW
ncbi:MAG: TonB-dependent receptor [Chitinophagales bacterium]|nr:TonB-dependent receptor [Chitinophagales bacterium]